MTTFNKRNMKKLFNNKRNVFILLLLLSAAIMAQMTVRNKVNIDEGLSVSEEKDMPLPPADDVWKEIEKLSDKNDMDSFTITGKVKLYDNLDEEGIHEQQDFLMEQEGENQWFRLEMFERIKTGHSFVLIDHSQKEVVVQDNRYADSVLTNMKVLSPKEMKKMLQKDGTAIELLTEGNMKVLNIKPGLMDAVNEYHIFYDPASYEIKKIRLSYTSFPYQDMLGYDEDNRQQGVGNRPVEEDSDEDNQGPEIEMNITEYVLEFEFLSKERKTTFNFLNNELFRVVSDEISFKQKLADYKVTAY
jgi:hypothetical protein